MYPPLSYLTLWAHGMTASVHLDHCGVQHWVVVDVDIAPQYKRLAPRSYPGLPEIKRAAFWPTHDHIQIPLELSHGLGEVRGRQFALALQGQTEPIQEFDYEGQATYDRIGEKCPEISKEGNIAAYGSTEGGKGVFELNPEEF